MPTINENSTAFLTVTFRNRSGVEEAPAWYKYRIDSSLDDELLSWTSGSMPASSSFELVLSSSYNKVNNSFDFQTNVVTIEATFANNQKKTDTYKYTIRNLRKQ